MTSDPRKPPTWPRKGADATLETSRSTPHLVPEATAPHEHLTPYHLAAARQGDGGPERWEQLVSDCAECQEAAETLEHWSHRVGHPNPYVACEQAGVPWRLEVLSALPPEGRRLRIETDVEFHSWALCAALVAASAESLPGKPNEAAELATLAVAISRHLDEEFYEASRCADLRARALAQAGDAQRTLGQLRFAEELIEEAESWERRGTGQPGLLAEILRLRARLERARLRLDEAGKLLLEALPLYEEADDEPGGIHARVELAAVLLDEGERETARGLLLETLPRLRTAGVEPGVRAAALDTLAAACLRLDDLERFDEVTALLPRTDPLCELRRENLQVRRLVLRGGIAPARKTYRDLFSGYLRLGRGFDAAEAACEAMRLHLQVGDPPAAQSQALELTDLLFDPWFRSEPLQAVSESILRFVHLATRRPPCAPLLADFREYLLRARRRPLAPWNPENVPCPSSSCNSSPA